MLVIVRDDSIEWYDWQVTGAGKQVARWSRGHITTQPVRYGGERGVRVVDQRGRLAILTVRARRQRRLVRAVLEFPHPAGP